MVEFRVAIPSYRRAHILEERTLPLCLRWKIPRDRIYIFVVPEDVATYQEVLLSYPDIHLVSGPVGLHNMRNFITDFFEEGAPVLHMDDDIRDMYVMHDPTTHTLTPLDPLQAVPWISSAFLHTREKGLRLFGVYPVKNGYFMKDSPQVTYDLRFCVGVFWGIWNSKRIVLTLEEKEDFERTLLCFEHDHGVVRYNWISPYTSYYTTPGGMQARGCDRKEASKKSCEFLLQRWPQWCRLFTTKKSGHWEVRLRNR